MSTDIAATVTSNGGYVYSDSGPTDALNSHQTLGPPGGAVYAAGSSAVQTVVFTCASSARDGVLKALRAVNAPFVAIGAGPEVWPKGVSTDTPLWAYRATSS